MSLKIEIEVGVEILEDVFNRGGGVRSFDYAQDDGFLGAEASEETDFFGQINTHHLIPTGLHDNSG